MRQQIAPSKDHNAILLVRAMAKSLQLSLKSHIVTEALPKGMKPPVGRRAEEWKTRILAISTFPLLATQIRQPGLHLVDRELLLTPLDLRRRRDDDFSQLDKCLSRETQRLHCQGQSLNLTPGPSCILLRSTREALLPSDSGFFFTSYFVHPSLLSISW